MLSVLPVQAAIGDGLGEDRYANYGFSGFVNGMDKRPSQGPILRCNGMTRSLCVVVDRIPTSFQRSSLVIGN